MASSSRSLGGISKWKADLWNGQSVDPFSNVEGQHAQKRATKEAIEGELARGIRGKVLHVIISKLSLLFVFVGVKQ